MKKIIILINLCVLLLMTGCAKEVKKDEPLEKKNDRPDWIDKPEPNIVGKCGAQAEGQSHKNDAPIKKL